VTAPVAIDARAARAWPTLHGIAYARPGTVIVGLAGEVLRVREDGGADEVNAIPRRWSVSADPTAARRGAA
jgi:hypothetical protein